MYTEFTFQWHDESIEKIYDVGITFGDDRLVIIFYHGAKYNWTLAAPFARFTDLGNSLPGLVLRGDERQRKVLKPN